MNPWMIRLVCLAVALIYFYSFRHPEKTRWMYRFGNPSAAFLKNSALTMMLTALGLLVASFFIDVNAMLEQ